MKKLLLLIVFSNCLLAEGFGERFAQAAMVRTTMSITYDGSYHRLKYPGGDVPENIGVCTDLIIRSYRKFGIDLQVLVHEDMKRNFSKYPARWGLSKPDKNIDHRRVPNLRRLFERKGAEIPLSDKLENYKTGDLVTWNVMGRPHIGIVSDYKTEDGKRPLFIHNIGRGPELMDFFDAFERTGHYRFHPATQDIRGD